jgi:two-component system, NarL family, sensor histidine kinase UhpB
MAREVHDVLGQLLTALKMDVAWWERRFRQLTEPGVREVLEAKARETNHLLDLMVETVQQIARELRPSVLDGLGLGAALRFEGMRFAERTGITCEVKVPEAAIPLDADRATGMFRVFQELLTNVARHARATRIDATLEWQGAELRLEVRDNGRGISPEALRSGASLGLLGMRERAAQMGGSIHLAGEEGVGTTASLTIPRM